MSVNGPLQAKPQRRRVPHRKWRLWKLLALIAVPATAVAGVTREQAERNRQRAVNETEAGAQQALKRGAYYEFSAAQCKGEVIRFWPTEGVALNAQELVVTPGSNFGQPSGASMAKWLSRYGTVYEFPDTRPTQRKLHVDSSFPADFAPNDIAMMLGYALKHHECDQRSSFDVTSTPTATTVTWANRNIKLDSGIGPGASVTSIDRHEPSGEGTVRLSNGCTATVDEEKGQIVTLTCDFAPLPWQIEASSWSAPTGDWQCKTPGTTEANLVFGDDSRFVMKARRGGHGTAAIYQGRCSHSSDRSECQSLGGTSLPSAGEHRAFRDGNKSQLPAPFYASQFEILPIYDHELGSWGFEVGVDKQHLALRYLGDDGLGNPLDVITRPGRTTCFPADVEPPTTVAQNPEQEICSAYGAVVRSVLQLDDNFSHDFESRREAAISAASGGDIDRADRLIQHNTNAFIDLPHDLIAIKSWFDNRVNEIIPKEGQVTGWTALVDAVSVNDTSTEIALDLGCGVTIRTPTTGNPAPLNRPLVASLRPGMVVTFSGQGLRVDKSPPIVSQILADRVNGVRRSKDQYQELDGPLLRMEITEIHRADGGKVEEDISTPVETAKPRVRVWADNECGAEFLEYDPAKISRSEMEAYATLRRPGDLRGAPRAFPLEVCGLPDRNLDSFPPYTSTCRDCDELMHNAPSEYAANQSCVRLRTKQPLQRLSFRENAAVNDKRNKLWLSHIVALDPPPQVKPLVDHEIDRLRFFVYLEGTRLAYLQGLKTSALARPYGALQPRELCQASLQSVAAAPNYTKRWALIGSIENSKASWFSQTWYGCMTGAYTQQVEPSDTAALNAAWAAFLEHYNITVAPDSRCDVE